MLSVKRTEKGYSFELRNIARVDLNWFEGGQLMVNALFDFTAVKRAREAVKRANEEVGLRGNPEKVYNKTFEHSEPIPEAKA